MNTDDIIALSLLTVGGVYAYLMYTGKIDWPDWLPKDIIPDLSESKKEEKDIEDKIANETGNDNDNDKDDVADFLKNPFKKGQDLLKNTPIIPKNLDFKKPKILEDYFDDDKSIDDLISDALKGNPFRPYSGTKYRPYG
jgi:hypothetical protein